MSSYEPFGDADASAANAFERSEFIEFTRRRFRLGLGMSATDGDARVIVGAKGAGKTIYLRRLQQGLSRKSGVYVDTWHNRPPATDNVLEVWSLSTSVDDCRRRWSLIWRRAILRSVASHLIKAKSLGAPESVRDMLRHDFPELLPKFEARSSAISQVDAIITTHGGVHALDKFLRHNRWEALEEVISEALDDTRPVYLILDGLDEEFEAAPSQWLDCQEGLLRQVLALRAGDGFRRRLHVIVGIRDLVYATFIQSENAQRFRRSPAIRHLRWDRDAVSHFLHAKISALDAEEWLLDPSSEDPVARWLGLPEVWNVPRDCRENIERYLLRHTRCLPRDIIQIGNALCDQIAADHDRCLNAEIIRRTVAGVSREFADEQLWVVANHITAALMPREAPRHGFVEAYVNNDSHANNARGARNDVGRSYQTAVIDMLRAGLRDLGEDRVEADALERFAEGLPLLEGVDLLSILWQHKLIGYIDGSDRLYGPVVFCGMNGDDLSLPRDKAAYALHPILIDSVEGLRGVGDAVEM
jgi:hypothetical protein